MLAVGLALSASQVQHSEQATGFSSGLPKISSSPLPMAPMASVAPYDEQVGVTFTQDFAALAFNVTTVAFTDNGIGPGYLVNGLTDLGYWYQVGLSYNWPMTNGNVNPGFSMNYEVFSPSLVSIYPSNGGGGIWPFNGTVNAGDSVLLSLGFSAGAVVMQARDWQTRSGASRSFAAHASSKIFVGLKSSLDQSGFFSGLMTEQYHYYPYYLTGPPVTYSGSGTALLSAWMWMDEWNTNTGQPVFGANTTQPVSLGESTGEYFSSNGTAEIATSHKLVTGLTPVSFPTLLTGSGAIGQLGHGASVNLVMQNQDAATVSIDSLTISTSFGKYNISSGTPFSFGPGLGQYSLTILLPSNLELGNYNLTIDLNAWKYLDNEAQTWIRLHPASVNQTLFVTNGPPPSNPPNSPGPSPPKSGQGPSSTNRTTLSPASILTLIRSQAVPLLGAYAVLGLLAMALIRQERRKSDGGICLGLRFCPNCGQELSPYALICSNCQHATTNVSNISQSSLPTNQDQTQNAPESG